MGHEGFTEVTRLAAAREELLSVVNPPAAAESVPVAEADGLTLADSVAATRDVPGFDRAAMDGYAVRATDTHDASDRSPAVLDETGGDVTPGLARYVHTGSPMPDGADAVVKVEETDTRGDRVEVFAAVPPGENVAPAGEDVRSGDRLFDAGRRLRPSDLGLLKAGGHRSVSVRGRPTVSVIPTGEELVAFDPGYGETTETNGLTVSRLVERWGGEATYRDIVGDDEGALRAAVERDTDHDIVVTTGGSSVGERDLIADVVADLGDVLGHGVALKPGHPVGYGVVDDTPVLTLPGYPVSCLVTAVQLLRPAVAKAGGFEPEPFPAFEATLDRKIASEVGVRSFVRVRETDEGTVEPVRGGAGVLSSVAAADGWVVVPESLEGVAAGESVTVERWEAFH
ncbi:molybdenum cofactor synthesis protein [Halosimplex carlsbadense 2-9-1]|uniref:Molybdenum cofactor synthesis protein n=1 Tax=Halosimplex carlsbadense 2-9-1 TaxID=797114 RepID=M0CGB1_9EURY|nr:gephyrin-like molybdotransferase Glp [Halosimplex carlsbadense]ELZ22291.1 molybdenum cofactor synthesis protein [Halosimplex carlsbadense 2-9-1]